MAKKGSPRKIHRSAKIGRFVTKKYAKRHHLYRKEDVEEKINLQRGGNKAKPYQVRQVRAIILKYHLAGKE